jgi:hypothetical protein
LQGIDDEHFDCGDGNPRKSNDLKVGHYEGLAPVLSFELRLGVLRYKVIEAVSILAAFTD